MDMFILILLIMFAGLVVYQLSHNLYIHLVVGSIIKDIINFFKKLGGK